MLKWDWANLMLHSGAVKYDGCDVQSRRVDVMMIGSEPCLVVLVSMVLEVAKMALVFYFYFFSFFSLQSSD